MRLNWFELTMIGAIVLIIGLLIWSLMQPTCEDKGGTSVFKGRIPVVTFVNNVPITNMIPIYDCVFTEESGNAE